MLILHENDNLSALVDEVYVRGGFKINDMRESLLTYISNVYAKQMAISQSLLTSDSKPFYPHHKLMKVGESCELEAERKI